MASSNKNAPGDGDEMFSDNGIVLKNGAEIPFFAGEYHYWHHDAKTWRESLQALKDMGFTVVSTCVPWSEHEESSGTYNFAGDRDLGAFLDVVADVGLFAVLQLGPGVGAGLGCGGFPKRIVANKAIGALSCRLTPLICTSPPTMFPLPSYASSTFRNEVVAWFAVVGKVVAPRMHVSTGLNTDTDLSEVDSHVGSDTGVNAGANAGAGVRDNANAGVVLAVSVDAGQAFWRLAAFEGDYHPDALSWWQEYSDGQEAPKGFSEEIHAAQTRMEMQNEEVQNEQEMQRILLWMKFKEEYVSTVLTWLMAAATSAGMTPCNAGLPAARPTLVNVPSAQRCLSGIVGMEFSDLISDYSRVRQRASYLNSTAPLPYATCLPVGGAFFLPVRDEQEEKNIALGALAGGIRAFHLYMAQGRPRWQGGIVGGTSKRRATWVDAMLSALHRISFHTLRKQTSAVALIVGRAEVRAAVASSALETVSPAVTEFLSLGPSGFAELALDESSRNYPRWISAVMSALDLAQVSYRIVDEESLHVLDDSTRAVIYPTLKRVDASAWAGLHMLAEAGIRVVTGPIAPTQDELGNALGSLATLPKQAGMLTAESLDDVEGLSNDLIGLAGALENLWITPENSEIDCSVFEDSNGVVRALFVGNRGSQSQDVRVNVADESSLEDAISGEQFSEEAGTVLMTLGPQEVRFFLVG